MKIHHFAIKVKNIDSSINFYIEKLGFKIETPKVTTEDGLYIFAYLNLNGSLLEVVQCNDGKEIKDNALFPHIGFESDDIEKDLKYLKSRGIKILEGPYIDLNNVKIITFADPDGYRIDIGQILKKN